MFKKFTYLASVSVLASVVMTQASYGMDPSYTLRVVATKKKATFQDHYGVLYVIDEFCAPTQPLAIAPQSEQEVSTGWWLVSKVCSTCGKVTGNGLRWLGEQVRGDTFVGDLLMAKALEYGTDPNATGAPTASLVKTMGNNEGIIKSFRLAAGNLARYFGGLLAGETPTLARAIRHFWIENQYGQKPEDAFTSTACALYLSSYMRGVNQITQGYREFVEAWNGSSSTKHSLDAEMNQTHFLHGITRAYVLAKVPINEAFAKHVLALGFDLEKYPATKLITKDTILKDNPGLAANLLDAKIQEARNAKFLEEAKKIYDFENTVYAADQHRLQLIAPPAPAPVPAPTVAAAAQDVIETPSETNELGQSLIEFKKPEDNSNTGVDDPKPSAPPQENTSADPNDRDMEKPD